MFSSLEEICVLKYLKDLGYKVPTMYYLGEQTLFNTFHEKIALLNNRIAALLFLKEYKNATGNEIGTVNLDDFAERLGNIKEGISLNIDILIILKYMQANGFASPEYITEPYATSESYWELIQYVSQDILNNIGVDVTITTATEENSIKKGYTLYYDEDDVTMHEITIRHPIIMDYLKSFKHISDLEGTEYKEKISDLSSYLNYPSQDMEYTESIISKDLDGIIIVTTNIEFLDKTFIEKFKNILDYCKESLVSLKRNISA